MILKISGGVIVVTMKKGEPEMSPHDDEGFVLLPLGEVLTNVKEKQA